MIPALVLAAAYLMGAVPTGYILVRLTTGRDVRSMGSGNIGATNVLRTSGRKAGIVTLLLDMVKGWLAVYFAGRVLDGSLFWMTGAALAVMAGHAFPVFLHFRGGKAVASFVGAFLCLTPASMLATIVVFVATVAASRYVSLGSVVAAGLFPFAVWLIEHPPAYVVWAAVIAGGFIIWRHRANLQRIRAGSENLLSFGSRRP
ncbi:MAG TPA: glycerol-3-phosphate 1-O-acyltransferase PlsY [Bryobacteraceae bacterium]|nr:glycerol-3-phosphate 1-O-acyltransferase PlsY [Bryobacteraceae bacterium]